MKTNILQTLATALTMTLCFVVCAVAAPNIAPIAPASVQKAIASPAPVAVTVAVSVSAASADCAINSINYSVIENSMTAVVINADANDHLMIGRHSETNELIAVSPPNISQLTFNSPANRSLINPVPKRRTTGFGDQRFHLRE